MFFVAPASRRRFFLSVCRAKNHRRDAGATKLHARRAYQSM